MHDAAVAAQEVLERGTTMFAAGQSTATLLRELNLLTTKPFLYVFNADESVLGDEERKAELRALVAPADAVFLDAKIEAELAGARRRVGRRSCWSRSARSERGLDALARVGFHTLGLQTYLTAGPKESRAWTIHQGDTAPKAAGVIHTDFEKGFIKAEVVSFDDLDRGRLDGRGQGRRQGPDGGQGLRDGRRRRRGVPLQRVGSPKALGPVHAGLAVARWCGG